MTKAAFEKVVEGLLEVVVVTAMAKSDAEFDGRPWESLGRKDRERYLQRSIRGLDAAKRAEQVASAISQIESGDCEEVDPLTADDE